MAELEGIAVVGVSGRYPGVEDVKSFWEKLVGGSRQGRCLDGAECFEPGFLGLVPGDAEAMEPWQRHLLEQCWAALEDAKAPGVASRGRRTGVFLETRASSSGGPRVLSFWLSRFPALGGSPLIVDEECTSSQAAIHRACQQLREGLVDQAIAGGVFAGSIPAGSMGVVVLKPLPRALAEGNRIHGVIRARDRRREAQPPAPAPVVPGVPPA
jgi:acyl transferase domain-containing protein